MDYSGLKQRYVGLDILRIVSAVVVCMFHTTIHLGCNYGILQGLSISGAVFMTAFFMLSGFTLFVNWGGKSFNNFALVKSFWLKRVISIIPIYLIVAFVYDIIHIVFSGQSVLKTILLAPIEVIGLQSAYSSLFSQSHNGGTWFISCILICYFIYPFIQEIIKSITRKSKTILLGVLTIILLYSPIICYIFKLESIYSNPIFRCMEFAIGIILASLKVDYKNCKLNRIISNYWTISAVSILMIVAITIAVRLNIAVGNYMLYSWICLPCFCIIILGLSGLDFEAVRDSLVVKKLSAISYVFFLAQLFSNDLCKYIINQFAIDSNIIKIVLGLGACVIIAFILRIIEIVINGKLVKVSSKHN